MPVEFFCLLLDNVEVTSSEVHLPPDAQRYLIQSRYHAFNSTSVCIHHLDPSKRPHVKAWIMQNILCMIRGVALSNQISSMPASTSSQWKHARRSCRTLKISWKNSLKVAQDVQGNKDICMDDFPWLFYGTFAICSDTIEADLICTQSLYPDSICFRSFRVRGSTGDGWSICTD